MSTVEIKKLNAGLSVCGQLHADDIASIKERGFRTVFCLRPDGEEAGQPPYREIADAAGAAGLETACLPVVASQIGPEQIAAYEAAMATLPQPVLAYCRSGARVEVLADASAGAKK